MLNDLKGLWINVLRLFVATDRVSLIGLMRKARTNQGMYTDSERALGANQQKTHDCRGIPAAFLDTPETAQPETTVRERIIRDIVSGHQQPYIDQALLRRLQELVWCN